MRRLLSFAVLLASTVLGLQGQDFTVAISVNPASSGTTTGAGTYASGTNVTVTAAPATGYQFVNWTANSIEVSKSASFDFIISADTILVANFSLLHYNVTASASPEEGGIVTGTGEYSHGATVTLTATPNAGYAFLNWTNGADVVSTQPTWSFEAISDITVTANFARRYTVTLESNPDEGGTTEGAGSYDAGATATVTATPAAGYTFYEWKEGSATISTSNPYTFQVNSDISLKAEFEPVEYQINTTSSPVTGGTVTGAGTYTHGTSVNLSATPASGYSFINWTEEGTQVSINSSYTFTAESNRDLVANFSQNTFSVTTASNPPAGGTTDGGGTFNSGSSVTVTATPLSGYQFVNWSEGGSTVSSSESYTFTLDSNRTLVANFSQINYTVTTSSSPSEGGTTIGGGTCIYGDAVTVTAVPASGYQFVNWTQGGTTVSTNSSYSFTVTGDRTLTANFSQITYTVALSSAPAAGGTASGGGTYGAGTTATVTATPATGYRFVNWTRGGTVISANPVYSFPVTTNVSLVANFAIANYTITTTVSPSGTGTASGGGSFNHGASVTVRATPATGYQFTNWTENGSAVSTSTNYTFTVSRSRNLLANFSQIPKVLTLTGPEGNNLQNNDIISLDSPVAGSLVITVNANADWSVTENSLWFNAVKEGDSRIRINYLENISVTDKEGPLEVSTTLNAELQVIVRQEARLSQLSLSKFDDIIIFPNPAGDRTRLLFPREIQGKIRVTLSSVRGIPVKTSEYADLQANQTFELDLTGIRPGQYLMIISDETDQKTFRMIKF